MSSGPFDQAYQRMSIEHGGPELPDDVEESQTNGLALRVQHERLWVAREDPENPEANSS